MRYWPLLILAIILGALFAPFGITPLPWQTWKYAVGAFFTVTLLALVFVRRRRPA
jgi:hypothetical protein